MCLLLDLALADSLDVPEGDVRGDLLDVVDVGMARRLGVTESKMP